mgnify:CR=1 FL=1
MEYRVLGRTNLRVSALGFGCGNVGGLMIRGTRAERGRAVARALDLRRELLRHRAALRGRRVGGASGRGPPSPQGAVPRGDEGAPGPRQGSRTPAATVTRSSTPSLRRLRRDRVDLLQLHDPVRAARADGQPGADEVLERILPAFETLRRAGKIGFVGMTAIGDTPAVHRVLGSGAVDSAQVRFNLSESDCRLRRAAGLSGAGLRPAARPDPRGADGGGA